MDLIITYKSIFMHLNIAIKFGETFQKIKFEALMLGVSNKGYHVCGFCCLEHKDLIANKINKFRKTIHQLRYSNFVKLRDNCWLFLDSSLFNFWSYRVFREIKRWKTITRRNAWCLFLGDLRLLVAFDKCCFNCANTLLNPNNKLLFILDDSLQFTYLLILNNWRLI